jgi:hypothetical protein
VTTPQLDDVEVGTKSVVDALLVEYQLVRQDMRASESMVVALAGAVVAVLVGVVALFLRAHDPLRDFPWVWALLPGITLAFGAYGLMELADVVVRSYYARVVERQLNHHLPAACFEVPYTDEEGVSRVRSLPLPSWAHIEIEMNAPQHACLVYAPLFLGTWLVIDLIPVVIAAMAFQRARPLWAAALAGAGYLAVWTALNYVAYRNVRRGYKLWSRTLERLEAGLKTTLTGPREKRKSLFEPPRVQCASRGPKAGRSRCRCAPDGAGPWRP